MGQDGEADRAAQIQMLAAVLDRSELGREASTWLKQQAQLTKAQLRLLEKKVPPTSRRQRIFDALARTGPLALSIGTALFVFAMLALVASAIWIAARERVVIVEALSVPQSLVNHGVTGQVAASELLDRMLYMQHSGIVVTGSKMEVVPPGTPVKVEISDTTITLDEVFVYLRNWFGHDTFVSGELIDLSPAADKTVPAGSKPAVPKYELIARVGNGACTAAGSNLDFIYGDVAGCVLRMVDPYRYATFLASQNGRMTAPCNIFPQYPDIIARTNVCRAVTIFREMVEENADDRVDDHVDANALATIGYLVEQTDNFSCLKGAACARPNLNDALAYEVWALQLFPRSVLALGNKLEIETDLGHAHDALADNEHLVKLYQSSAASDLDPTVRKRFQFAYEAGLDELRYDYGSALAKRAWLVKYSPSDELPQRQEDYDADKENEYIVLREQQTSADVDAETVLRSDCFPTGIDERDLPPIALANAAECFAGAGDYPDALSTIARTPAVCYDCVLEHGVIRLLQARAAKDSAAHQDLIGRAEWWSEKARALAPDLPGGWFDLGKEKMEANDWGGAAAAFAAAHARAPHNADILEYWGVLLLEKFGRPRLAITKFSEASAYAPQWGQLYMKWGEALTALKKFNEASAKYHKARSLALAQKEQAELLKASSKNR